MRKNIVIYVAFIIILLSSLRSLFFLKSNVMLGHHWDWIFPDSKFLSDQFYLLSKYTWWNYNLGTQLNLTISALIPNMSFDFFSKIFGMKIVILGLIILIITISFLSFKKLIDFITVKKTINYIPAFLYAFSPFLFNSIIGGALYAWVTYSLAPIFFLSLIEYVDSKSVKYLGFFLLSSVFVILSLQYFVLIEIIIILYLFYNVLIKKYLFKKAAIRYLLAHAVLIIINLYWIIPLIGTFLNFYHTTVGNKNFAGGFAAVRDSHQSILHILMLYGYLDRDMYFHALPNFLMPIFVIATIVIWILIVLSVFLRKPLSDYGAIPWFFILLLLIILIKDATPPFGNLTMGFYNIFPLMKLYRSPQHLMFGAAFIVPVLVAYSLNYFYLNSRYKKAIVSIFGICIFIWIAGWWYNGDLGHTILKNKHRDYIDFYSLPSELEKIYKQDEKSPLFHRILFLPSVCSPQYLKTGYQNNDQGGISEYMYLKNPTFCAESNPFANETDAIFFKKTVNNNNFINYLALFSIKDIILRKDIFPLSTMARKYWNYSKVKYILNSSKKLHKFSRGAYEIHYRLKPKYFLPLVYTSPNLLVVHINKDYQYNRSFYSSSKGARSNYVNIFWHIAISPYYKLRTAILLSTPILSMPNSGKRGFELNQIIKNLKMKRIEIIIHNMIRSAKANFHKINTPTIEFKNINPTKYVIIVHNAKANFPLILNQSYSHHWDMYIQKYPIKQNINKHLIHYKCKYNVYNDCLSIKELKNYIRKNDLSYVGSKFVSENFNGTIQNNNIPSGHILQTLFQTPYPNKYHFIVNGYANSWWININDIKKLGPQYYKVNKNGTYDFEFIIDYWPQRLFYIGIIISATTVVVFGLYLIYDTVRKRKTK